MDNHPAPSLTLHQWREDSKSPPIIGPDTQMSKLIPVVIVMTDTVLVLHL